MSSKTKTTATKEEATPARVPKLRFPEFREADGWAQMRLIDTADRSVKWSFIGGPFGSNLKSSDYVPDGVRIIQLQNIGDGEFFNEYQIFTTPQKADELLSNNIYPGEIIMSKMGDPVGRACLIPEDHDRYVMCSDGIRLVVDEKENDKYFIYSLINSPLFRAVVEKTATGSTRKRIGLDDLKSLPMWLPKKSEQQKIAECLSSVDELMAAQARKLEALKTHKKGLMQQLFPREGETQPRLRFPEFQNAGEWDVKPLGGLVELQSGFAFSSSNFGSEGRKLVTPKNFTKLGHGNFDESVSKYTTEDVPERFVCKPGDLLVLLTDLTPTCELLGKPLLLEEMDGTVLLNQRVVKVEASPSDLATLFLKYVFLSEPYNRRIKKTATGSTVKHSSNKVLMEMPLVYPSLDEQQRIATCLTSLDALITAETQKLEALKAHKKGLMQQLFPSPEDVAA
jgi:type I restriction enzyme, S subunit